MNKVQKNQKGHLSPPTKENYQAPRSDIEQTIAEIWQLLLGVEQIGVYDNFFELGGDSFLFLQMINAVATELYQEEADGDIGSLLLEQQTGDAAAGDFLPRFYQMPVIACLASQLIDLHEKQASSVIPSVSFTPQAKFPLSFSQQRLWFLHQLYPDLPLYTVFTALRLHGPLHLSAFEESLRALIARHDILRTTFSATADQPWQIIAPTIPLPLANIDLRQLPQDQRESELERFLQQERLHVFDLARGPLLRLHILQLTEEEAIFSLTMHHIIIDDWSLHVFWRELDVLYAGYRAGNVAALPALPLQYADYASWQRSHLQGVKLETQLAYWKRLLHGAMPQLALPTDYPRASVQSARGMSHHFQLPTELVQALTTLSQQEGVTLFMTLLASWQSLLSHYSGQYDISIGTPVAGRLQKKFADLIGFFANTLVLHTNLAGNPSFRQMLQRVRDVALQAYLYQEVPFEKLVEALQPERDLGYHPLFQVVFALQNAPGDFLHLSGIEVEPLQAANGPTPAAFDLELSLWPEGNDLTGILIFNADLFNAETIARMLQHWQILLQQMVKQPESRIGDVSLLTEEERQQILVEWNPAHEEHSYNASVHARFAEQAGRCPEAIALTLGSHHLSYKDCNDQANRLAHFLRLLGIGPGTYVGVLMETSLEVIISILGVLKAGGAFVPLDPASPPERLTFMIQDLPLNYLLTQRGLKDLLPVHPVEVIYLERVWDAISRQPSANPIRTVSEHDAAYVIYTSGSTGQPKGVIIEHAGLSNMITAQIDIFGLSAADRVLQFASLSFDASISELFITLLAGGHCCLIPPDQRWPASLLQEYLQEQAITAITLPPSVLAVLSPEQLPYLRRVISAGEALPEEIMLNWSRSHLLFNAYGPTEATVCTTIGRCDPGMSAPHIGRPIKNAEIYLLDAFFQPVPIGVIANLYIGGIGLARGYVHRPELTADTFLPHPFSTSPGARLYKTGDLARYLPDGSIEYRGRSDYQVKIRGYRVEPEEVEAVLRRHLLVQDVVVVVQADNQGDRRLVAYIVEKADQNTTPDLFHAFLQGQLPSYMHPASYVFLPALPLTPSGKVDRRALPSPPATLARPGETFIAPSTEIEVTVAAIWQELLQLAQIGVHDDFFLLGGHSLLATQVIARLRAAFGIELPVRSLFEAHTIAGMARVIEEELLTILETLSEEEAQSLSEKR